MQYRPDLKQTTKAWKILYFFPIVFFCCLGFLVFYQIYKLNEFSDDIANYYNPIIQVSRIITKDAIVLRKTLNSHSLEELKDGHDNSLTSFKYSIALFDRLVNSDAVAKRHQQIASNKDIIGKSNEILDLLSKSDKRELITIESLFNTFIKDTQQHLGSHQEELERTQAKMKTFSRLHLIVSALLLVAGIFTTLGIKILHESFEREIEAISAMTALVNALEAKDHYTRGHSLRVAKMAADTAKELGFKKKICQKLFLAGILHDIGKIGIPDKVLLSKGKLTPEEYASIQSHPWLGKKILQGSVSFKEIIAGVYHHHEKYDGSGYPEGLIGENIPITAQCISIADAWDAMTTARPYKKAMPWKDAKKEINRCRTTHWSNRIVSSFLKIVDNHENKET